MLFPPFISIFSCTSVLQNHDSLPIQCEVKNIQKYVFFPPSQKENNAKQSPFHEQMWKKNYRWEVDPVVKWQ